MSSESTERVRERFRTKAAAFDRLYEQGSWLDRRLRPGLRLRGERALRLVEELADPRVLDVGCGSGRIGEATLELGAREYVGVDLSETMLTLAEERLARFGPRVRLVEGDFLEVPLEGRFEVVLALGLFDYVADPPPLARRMRELCSGVLVASFPRWTWGKGPIRKLRYEVIGNCPIFDYTPERIEELFTGAGFSDVRVFPLAYGGLYAEIRP
jgi:SAM-dependent methyltransferase